MNFVLRFFLLFVLLAPIACSIGCGESNKPRLVTEGMTDEELQAQFEATDAAEKANDGDE